MTDTRSSGPRCSSHSAVMIVTMEALDAWWPPDLEPGRVGAHPVGVVDDRGRQPQDALLDLAQGRVVGAVAQVHHRCPPPRPPRRVRGERPACRTAAPRSGSGGYRRGPTGRQPGGGSSPTSPSTASRSRSAWPVCRPYSSTRSNSSRRRLACRPPSPTEASRSSPPSASACRTRARDRSTAASHPAYRSAAASCAAEVKSPSGSASPSAERHGSPGATPSSFDRRRHVLDGGEVLEQAAEGQPRRGRGVRRPASSSPSAFHRNVARSRSRAPSRCSTSLPASGGSHHRETSSPMRRTVGHADGPAPQGRPVRGPCSC